MYKTFAIVLMLVLTGCMSSEQILAEANKRCSTYGFKSGSLYHAQCMAIVDNKIRDQQREDIASVADGIAEAGKAFQTQRVDVWVH